MTLPRFSQNALQRVLIGVCTRNRPIMLRACLDSLLAQTMTPDLSVEFVVVDNNDAGSTAEDMVAAIQKESPFPVHYLHEPCAGIAIARNRVLDFASLGAFDWIAFIDDDETADTEWIADLMAPRYRDTPVLMGRQVMLYPQPKPFWCIERKEKPRVEGEVLRVAYTNNVRFSVALVKAGLRFNERLGLGGGSDTEFFARANKHGFTIRRTIIAVTYERAHPERLTFQAQYRRAHRNAVTNLRALIIRNGAPAALLRKIPTIPLNFALGLVLLAVSPASAIVSLNLFKRLAMMGADKLARALGRAAALTGRIPQPYRVVEGK
jgi:succinoglycan biosynthesis protein ExoM